jgi:hypothetical protein
VRRTTERRHDPTLDREGGHAKSVSSPVLGGHEQLGERVQGGHELLELVRSEDLVGLRGEVVGERLDALVDGVTLFGQPAVLADQATVA